MKISFDLQHKIRKVSDLVRFIANTSIESVSENKSVKIGNPNFSILLGAGASISSGIQSGGQLVKRWKEEVYNDLDGKSYDCSLEDFYRFHKPDWYDEANPYSSLFEHRYDLQRQRRIFVEKEVAGKTPSIGYAYLVKLMAAGYFNTVFTTNFDDLLNEAFYRFTHVRPIVCAHDSSISGVTITSDRPKIIKLHGDYLFDNIKTTLRETESLETNMQMKFQEFAKDYGLIVIGYSGQDRSIMDILNYLIQHEEYLKNGIYWCIMKGELDKITGELKKFLWKDRVYIVEIDGFDELMSEINKRLTDDPLPIQTDLMNRGFQEKIITDLADNTFVKNTKSLFLEEGLDALKNTYQAESRKDFINFVNKSRQDGLKQQNRAKRNPELRRTYPEVTIEEALTLENLYHKLTVYNKEEEVVSQLQTMNILSFPTGEYKRELLEMYIDVNRNVEDSEIIPYIDALISIEPRREGYYVMAAQSLKETQNKQQYFDKAIELFPNDYYVYNSYSRSLLNVIEESISLTSIPDWIKQKICKYLDKSIELNPVTSNEAYTMKAQYYKVIYANQLDRQKSSIDDICKQIEANKNLYHPNYLKVLSLSGRTGLKEKYEESINFYKYADNLNILEDCVLQYIQYLKSEQKPFVEMEKVYTEYSKDYSPSMDLVIVMAHIYKDNEYFDETLKLITDLPEIPEVLQIKLQINHFIGNDNEVDKIFNRVHQTHNICSTYYELKGNYRLALQHLEDTNKYMDIPQESDLIARSYLLLQLEQYDEVVKLIEPYKNESHSVPMLLNEIFAQKCKGKEMAKIKPLVEKILNNQYQSCSTLEKVAAYAILENKREMLANLKKIVQQRPFEKYSIIRWPIMKQYIDDQEVQHLLTSTPKRLEAK